MSLSVFNELKFTINLGILKPNFCFYHKIITAIFGFIRLL
ncbi:hypothetical protein PROPEN_02199 [Proteus penneri ATCC 35198]|nr:hypothetical protein PROPEN_02199 [Proteus penneri ATCC 35198]